MITFLLVLQFVLTVILTITVLLQKSSSIGLGAYSGSNESVFGAKGADGFLAKFTFTIGAAFIINTVALGYLYNKQSKDSIAEIITKEIPNTPVQQNSSPIIPSDSKQKTPIVPTTLPKNITQTDVKQTDINASENIQTPVTMETNQTK